MLWSIFLIVILFLLLFAVAPSLTRSRATRWRGTPFAHRGLHGGSVPENTIEAFERACRSGFGIELDVQLTRDGVPVVFHDDTLKRMTGDERRVDGLTLSELRLQPLPIPTLGEALTAVGGRVPLLIEIKTGRDNNRLCAETLRLLRGYSGDFLVESFNPFILAWMRRNAPEIVRGQLVNIAKAYVEYLGPLKAFVLSRLALNFLARPDFVAYNIRADHFSAPRVQRALFHTPMAAWTVTDPETFRACLDRREMPIFEGFLPEKDA